MVGFKNGSNWDFLRCKINFDGALNANENSRYWTVADFYADDIPYFLGATGVTEDS